MQGSVINPVRGELAVGKQRYSVGVLDLNGSLRISFLAKDFKLPANAKASLDDRPIVIDDLKMESPFTPNRTWTLIAHYQRWGV